MFAGGDAYYLPLREENDFLPDLDAVPRDVAEAREAALAELPEQPDRRRRRPRLLRATPSPSPASTTSPSATTAPTPRSPSTATGPSASSRPTGARDVGIEFHSLSKTYNMTGWRIGMAVGNARDHRRPACA